MAKLKQGELKEVFGDSEELHKAVVKAGEEYEKLQAQKKKVSDEKDNVLEEMEKINKARLNFGGLKYKINETTKTLSISKIPNKE